MGFTEWYLQQAIKDQICIGFMSIFMIGSLMSTLIYSVFCNGMYCHSLHLQLNYFETNEYNKIESVISFINQQLFLYEEISKLSIQVLRELVDTFNETEPQYNKADILVNEIKCPDKSQFSVICYQNSLPMKPICTNFHKKAFLLLPIIKAIDSIELLWFGSEKILSDISIYIESCTTYYLKTEDKRDKAFYKEINLDYNESYANLINLFNSNISTILKDYYVENGVDLYSADIPKKNPYIQYGNGNISSVYKHESFGSTVINGRIIESFTEYIVLNVLKSFPSFSFLITSYDSKNQREKVITPSSCLYLLITQTIGQSESTDMTNFSFEEIYNQITSLGDDFTLDHCFLDSEAKEDMLSLTYSGRTTEEIDSLMMNNYFLKRKFSLGTYHFISSESSERYLYEVIKSSFPDPNFLKTFHSRFIKYEQYYFYSLYPNFSSYMGSLPLRNREANLSCFVIIVLLTLWRLINIGVYFIMAKISNDVTRPLNQLKISVESMTLNEDSNLEFKDDDDINDLFGTCKDILKGALVIHKRNYDQKESKSNLKDFSSNIIVNQAKLDENPVKTNILNCSCKWIMTYDKCNEKEKNNDRPFNQADKDQCDSNKKDFIHLAEVICNLRNKKDNILYNCYAKQKQDKILVSTSPILTSSNSIVEKNSSMNILSKYSLRKKKTEFKEEENKTMNLD